MDWILFTGLMLGGVVFVVVLLLRLRGWAPRIPPWIPVVGMIAGAFVFVASLVAGSWLNVMTGALNVLMFGLIFVATRRAAAL